MPKPKNPDDADADFDFESPGDEAPTPVDDSAVGPDTPDEEGATPSSAKGEIVTKSKLGDITGLAPITIDRYFKEGAPVVQRGARRLGWKINTADFIAWLRRRDVRNATGDPDAQGFEVAKTREKEAQAELKEFQLRRLRGETVTIEEAGRIYAQEISEVRASLLASSGAIARYVAPVTDLAECERIVKSAITAAMERLVEKQKPEDWKPDDDADADAD